MGRHSADDGASVHPLVAAALEQRPTTVEPGRPRHGHGTQAAQGTAGGLGWPGDPADGTGLGWPADDAADTAAGGRAQQPTEERPARRRLGWRRLFGGGAADDQRRTSTAA